MSVKPCEKSNIKLLLPTLYSNPNCPKLVLLFFPTASTPSELLPNQVFIRTHQNRLSQSLTIDPIQWANASKKSHRFWSHFYNLTTYLIDRKDRNNFEKINLSELNFHSFL